MSAVPEAEDGREVAHSIVVITGGVQNIGCACGTWHSRENYAAHVLSAVPARDDERERLAALLAAIDYDDDAWDKQHSATWNYREWLDRIDAAAAPIRAVLAAAPLPEGQEGRP